MAHKGLSDEDLALLRKHHVPVPRSPEELAELLKEAERKGGETPLKEALREIRRRLAADSGVSPRG